MKERAIVIKEFRDAHDFTKNYKIGDDVSSFDESRKARLVSLGYVNIDTETTPVNTPPPAPIAKKNEKVNINVPEQTASPNMAGGEGDVDEQQAKENILY